jgi:hypothetical protein
MTGYVDTGGGAMHGHYVVALLVEDRLAELREEAQRDRTARGARRAADPSSRPRQRRLPRLLAGSRVLQTPGSSAGQV